MLYSNLYLSLSNRADYLHLDVMDGHFVSNLTFGAPVIASLRRHLPHALFDVHLMVSRPRAFIADMRAAGADVFTFHVEAEDDDIPGTIEEVKKAGMKVGLALKPATLLDSMVLPFLSAIDQLLVMTVEPGFGGQAFMPEMMGKVAQARALFPLLAIQVDGGISPSSIDEVAKAGANTIVAGSAVFRSDSPADVIAALRRYCAACVYCR